MEECHRHVVTPDCIGTTWMPPSITVPSERNDDRCRNKVSGIRRTVLVRRSDIPVVQVAGQAIPGGVLRGGNSLDIVINVNIARQSPRRDLSYNEGTTRPILNAVHYASRRRGLFGAATHRTLRAMYILTNLSEHRAWIYLYGFNFVSQKNGSTAGASDTLSECYAACDVSASPLTFVGSH